MELRSKKFKDTAGGVIRKKGIRLSLSPKELLLAEGSKGGKSRYVPDKI